MLTPKCITRRGTGNRTYHYTKRHERGYEKRPAEVEVQKLIRNCCSNLTTKTVLKIAFLPVLWTLFFLIAWPWFTSNAAPKGRIRGSDQREVSEVEWWTDQHINKEYSDQMESKMHKLYEEQFDAANYDILTVRSKVGDETVEFKMYGPKPTAQTKDIVTATIRSNHHWEQEDNADFQVRPHCQDTDSCGLFVDIGANIGYWSLFMAHLGYDVLSFEAMTSNSLTLYATLQDLVSPEIRERVRVFGMALSDQPRDAHVSCIVCTEDGNDRDGGLKCGEAPKCNPGAKLREYVQVHNLRHFMNDMFPVIADGQRNAKAISNLKIDVEGHEPKVLHPILDWFEQGLVDRMFAECFGHPLVNEGQNWRFFQDELGQRLNLLNPADLESCKSRIVNLKYERYSKA